MTDFGAGLQSVPAPFYWGRVRWRS